MLREISNLRKTLLLITLAFTIFLAGSERIPNDTRCYRDVTVGSTERFMARLQAPTTPQYPKSGCTVIYASDGQVALGGNNEDLMIPFTKVWFLPPEKGSFGHVYFGFEN